MIHAIGDRTCAVIGCHRRVAVHADGRCVHGRCAEHEREALSGAFAPIPAPDTLSGQRAVRDLPRAPGGSLSRKAAGSVVVPA